MVPKPGQGRHASVPAKAHPTRAACRGALRPAGGFHPDCALAGRSVALSFHAATMEGHAP